MFKHLLLVKFLLLPLMLVAQTADDYFHGGAQQYVFGEKQQAKALVQTGLSKFPQDPKLNALAGLLKKEEEQQQQKQDQQQDSAKNDEEQKQDQQRQDQAKQDQQDSQEQQKQDQQKQDQAKQDEQKQGDQQQAQKPEDKEGEEQEAQAAAAGQMTLQQAMQFLESQKQQDRTLIFAPPPDQKPKNPNIPLKDW